MNVRRRPSRSAARPPSSRVRRTGLRTHSITPCDVLGAIAEIALNRWNCHDHDRRIEDDDEESRAQQAQRVPAARVPARLGYWPLQRATLSRSPVPPCAWNRGELRLQQGDKRDRGDSRQDATQTPVTARVGPSIPLLVSTEFTLAAGTSTTTTVPPADASPPDPAALAAMAASFGVEILGPPA